ncbi:family 16 glycoside hydrolase [Paraflavitalea speifideaquila]|uniref:family 16 glycoside hydrolase n=1 Tax=Paraflavitalea speifideaquila TaxID=3076558 RepID=UPI0028E2B1DF|nr:family 16 glycoside hydrolase [Paraflavitalea speifideiaquila]
MYNVPDTARDVLWPAGIQFQVKEGATGDFILLENVTLAVRGETKGPGKSVAVPRLGEQEKPLGQWNTILIRHIKGACTQYLNGVLVNEGSQASSQSGRILLQYEGAPIDFRKVEIKSLK